MVITNEDALAARAGTLGTLNGIELALVSLQPNADPTEARIELHFYNENELDVIRDDPKNKEFFHITGGHRMRAGSADGQVQVVAVDPTFPNAHSPRVLVLTVAPIGDYSTYTLAIDMSVVSNIDPVFKEIDFKFRPGCFNVNCAPEWEPSPKPAPPVDIDYLAKDYDSFRHTMIAAMMERVPGWRPTSDADLDTVLLELWCVAADELSDEQDRVMSEAYLSTARKRVSLARHARLMDYHIHQGNQAGTWLALRLKAPDPADPDRLALSAGYSVRAGDGDGTSSDVFVTRTQQDLHFLLNDMELYTWSDTTPALAAGSTTADLNVGGEEPDTKHVRDLIRDADDPIRRLLIEEHLNPRTCHPPGRDLTKRQLLTLITGDGDQAAEALKDPLTEKWLLRVQWQEPLERDFCFAVADCERPALNPDGTQQQVSRFHGNLVEVFHGRLEHVVFKGAEQAGGGEPAFTETERWGTICELPRTAGPLAYTETPTGGEVPPVSTLSVRVDSRAVTESINLIYSDDTTENANAYMVETDEEGYSLLRFRGDKRSNPLPKDAEIHCDYQVGRGPDGNIGSDRLTIFGGDDVAIDSRIDACWNPFDVTNGRAPEPAAEIIRRVPEAYRSRQLRAVTLADYEDRAAELEDVSRAAARYAWTGSWRTVQVAVDPVGGRTLDEELRTTIARHLNAVRLIGEDLEIRPPLFVPLKIIATICIQAEFWPGQIRFVLEEEFSNGYTPDGRMGFFHPDRWTFGQALQASEVLGRIQSVQGVDHVIDLTMRRWNEVTPGPADIIKVEANEIIVVENDPDHMEEGMITFFFEGGRA
jgi:hypothetical protein